MMDAYKDNDKISWGIFSPSDAYMEFPLMLMWVGEVHPVSEDKVENMIVMLGLISFMAGRQTSKWQRGLFEFNRKPC